MMRSLYSGVAGLKTHQTKMDVIGNNIANVNTVGFKSSTVNFADTFYQTMTSATGSNAETGTAGQNAKQIGLGSSVASITTNITETGGTSTTNRALDVAINGDGFLIVNSGGSNYFTKSGALNVDDSGTLYCTTNGGTVMGWIADAEGNIIRDSVKQLTIMSEANMRSEPTATDNVTLSGNIDKTDHNLEVSDPAVINTSEGFRMTFSFYDRIGDEYTVQMGLQESGTSGTYNLVVKDVVDSSGNSIFVQKTVQADGTVSYSSTGVTVALGGYEYTVDAADVNDKTGVYTVKATGGGAAQVVFDTTSGEFKSTVENFTRPDGSEYEGKALLFEVTNSGTLDDTFTHYDAALDKGGVEVDVSYLTQYSSSGVSTASYTRGNAAGVGAGNVAGEMSGLSIDLEGKIIGSYTNGETKILGQIPVATFSNPSGLEAVGDSLFSATLNSGLFDGVGENITASGGSFTVGALEMSNVDLANEFTNMITTQRGFQANSRIITTSDSMLEELVNLKR